jgi:hypothetical protein
LRDWNISLAQRQFLSLTNKGEIGGKELGLCPRIRVRGGDKGQSPATWMEWLGGPYVHKGNNSLGHAGRSERENCVINADASQLPQELMTQVQLLVTTVIPVCGDSHVCTGNVEF